MRADIFRSLNQNEKLGTPVKRPRRSKLAAHQRKANRRQRRVWRQKRDQEATHRAQQAVLRGEIGNGHMRRNVAKGLSLNVTDRWTETGDWNGWIDVGEMRP